MKNDINNTEILVRIFDLDHGLTEYPNVKFIRIVSEKYNLLIMKDYMPIIGEIDGTLSMKGDDVDLNFENLKAYYVHHNNTFNLMIKES